LKPIAIGPKVLAGLLLQSKNTYVDRQKLEAARIKANEAAEEDFKKRLGKMYVEHKTLRESECNSVVHGSSY